MNKTHNHIHHPQLGDIPTGGDRFGAILIAAQRLHAIQQDRAHQDAVNTRIARKAQLLTVKLPARD